MRTYDHLCNASTHDWFPWFCAAVSKRDPRMKGEYRFNRITELSRLSGRMARYHKAQAVLREFFTEDNGAWAS